MSTDDPSEFPWLNYPKKGFVFIVTYGRSGSTLTQAFLNSHPDVLIRGENANLLYFFCKALAVLRNEKMFQMRRNFDQLVAGAEAQYIQGLLGKPYDPWYGVEKIDPQIFAKTLFDSFVKCILQPAGELVYLGFKEIRWTVDPKFFHEFLQIIVEYFPNTKFIFQTRSWKEVRSSAWWRTMYEKDVQQFIETSDRLFAWAHENYKNISLKIDYEDLKQSPLQTLRLISDFLALSFPEESAKDILKHRLKH